MKIFNLSALSIEQCSPTELPVSLLLEADPSEQRILAYGESGLGFKVCLQQQIVAACVLLPKAHNVFELVNISVVPEYQSHGIGNWLLSQVIHHCRNAGMHKLELGTGSFGYQLSFYQRQGFRVDAVLKDHFLNHYPDAIFEHGIQHKDMLWLTLDLTSN